MGLKKFAMTYIDETSLTNKEFVWKRLPADGSKRLFYRLSNEEGSYVVMANPPRDKTAQGENISYLNIGKHLYSKGIPVAVIYRYDLDHGWFIMKDLGLENLQEIARRTSDRIALYRGIIELLIKMQVDGRDGFDPGWCYHTQRYDRFLMERFESGYFFRYFLQGLLELKQDPSALRASFEHLSYQASLADNDFVLHRDFQSRNLIFKGERVGIVDWQGARLGPLQYDLASLLIDPYVGLEKDERTALYGYYLMLLEKRLPGTSGSFTAYYPYVAVQRNLQILGAFSYLSRIQGKRKFLAYVAPALRSLEELLVAILDPELSELKGLVTRVNKDFGKRFNASRRPSRS